MVLVNDIILFVSSVFVVAASVIVKHITSFEERVSIDGHFCGKV